MSQALSLQIKFCAMNPGRGPTTIELAGAALKGLLSPALSSRGGEGEETANSFGKWVNSMAVGRGPGLV